jgi:hypothetical protein
MTILACIQFTTAVLLIFIWSAPNTFLGYVIGIWSWLSVLRFLISIMLRATSYVLGCLWICYVCVMSTSADRACDPFDKYPQIGLTEWLQDVRACVRESVKPSYVNLMYVSRVKSIGHYMYHQFNIQQFYVLSIQCIYVFCVDLRTNSDYFPIQHLLTVLYNWEGVCLLRGTEYWKIIQYPKWNW